MPRATGPLGIWQSAAVVAIDGLLMPKDHSSNGRFKELEARRAAAVEFGNAAAALEESRDEWSSVWLDSVVQDLRYALRALRHGTAKSWLFTDLSTGVAA